MKKQVINNKRNINVFSTVKNLFTYRELIWLLILRSFAVRYKNMTIGVIWVILQPLVMALLITTLIRPFKTTDVLSYFLFIFTGWGGWQFAAGSLNTGANALINLQDLLKKIYFPRIIAPLAIVTALFFDLLINISFTIIVLVVVGKISYRYIWQLPFYLAWFYVFMLACSFVFSTISIKFRDVLNIIPFITMMWLFSSPIFLLTSRFEHILYWDYVNPLFPILKGLRHSLYGSENSDTNNIIVSVAICAIFFVCSMMVFIFREKSIIDDL